MIFDEYRIFNLELFSSELIKTSFYTFRPVLNIRVFDLYNLLLQKPTFKFINYKDEFIQMTKQWN